MRQPKYPSPARRPTTFQREVKSHLNTPTITTIPYGERRFRGRMSLIETSVHFRSLGGKVMAMNQVRPHPHTSPGIRVKATNVDQNSISFPSLDDLPEIPDEEDMDDSLTTPKSSPSSTHSNILSGNDALTSSMKRPVTTVKLLPHATAAQRPDVPEMPTPCTVDVEPDARTTEWSFVLPVDISKPCAKATKAFKKHLLPSSTSRVVLGPLPEGTPVTTFEAAENEDSQFISAPLPKGKQTIPRLPSSRTILRVERENFTYVCSHVSVP